MNDFVPIIGVILALLFFTYTGHLQKFWKEFKGCIGVIAIGIAISYLMSFCNNSTPTTTPQESAAMATEVARENDPCVQDILDGVPKEYSRCYNTSSNSDDFEYSDTTPNCPNGCTYHKVGCDIKGNISYNSGEKIYHLPGQMYYLATEIDPQYGERWFCTEAEARANKWRKASQ